MKEGATKEQFTNRIQYKEKKTIIKTMTKARTEKDDYHQLQREEQVVLLRLRSGHNRLNHHMATKLKPVPSDPSAPVALTTRRLSTSSRHAPSTKL
jgi:hypothetical protein